MRLARMTMNMTQCRSREAWREIRCSSDTCPRFSRCTRQSCSAAEHVVLAGHPAQTEYMQTAHWITASPWVRFQGSLARIAHHGICWQSWGLTSFHPEQCKCGVGRHDSDPKVSWSKLSNATWKQLVQRLTPRGCCRSLQEPSSPSLARTRLPVMHV